MRPSLVIRSVLRSGIANREGKNPEAVSALFPLLMRSPRIILMHVLQSSGSTSGSISSRNQLGA